MFVGLHLCRYIGIHAHMSGCLFVYMDGGIYACMFVCASVRNKWKYACKYVRMHACCLSVSVSVSVSVCLSAVCMYVCIHIDVCLLALCAHV